MRVLAIETSERVGTIAALQAVEGATSCVEQRTLPADQRSARSLLPTIQSLLGELNWRPCEIDLIAVTTGPGSFTGLRIGVTTAKTLAYTVGCQLVEVNTLAAIAAGVSLPYDRLWTVLDAQRQELFVAQFKPGWNEQASEQPNIEIVGVEQWLRELQSGDVVCGPPLKKIQERLTSEVQIADVNEWAPHASVVGTLGVAAWRQGFNVDIMQLVPRYYRKSAAEEKADQQR